MFLNELDTLFDVALTSVGGGERHDGRREKGVLQVASAVVMECGNSFVIRDI